MKNRIFLFVTLVFLCSCSLNKDVSGHSFATMQEKQEVEKFLRHLLFFESGVYTLLGSEPITVFEVFDGSEDALSNKDILNYPDIRIYLNKDQKRDLDFYRTLRKEDKKKTVFFSDRDDIFDGYDLWGKWEDFSSKNRISKRFLLSAKKVETEDGVRGYNITFVNVLQTACILEAHYQVFKNAIGRDFTPLEEALKADDPKSFVWTILNSEGNHREKGLLLGCGLEDIQVFSWKYNKKEFGQKNQKKMHKFLNAITDHKTADTDQVVLKKHPFSATNFPLPAFATFFPISEQKYRYQAERKRIMEFYKGKDFVESTLDVLTEAK